MEYAINGISHCFFKRLRSRTTGRKARTRRVQPCSRAARCSRHGVPCAPASRTTHIYPQYFNVSSQTAVEVVFQLQPGQRRANLPNGQPVYLSQFQDSFAVVRKGAIEISGSQQQNPLQCGLCQGSQRCWHLSRPVYPMTN